MLRGKEVPCSSVLPYWNRENFTRDRIPVFTGQKENKTQTQQIKERKTKYSVTFAPQVGGLKVIETLYCNVSNTHPNDHKNFNTKN